jgi:hypothetical protein
MFLLVLLKQKTVKSVLPKLPLLLALVSLFLFFVLGCSLFLSLSSFSFSFSFYSLCTYSRSLIKLLLLLPVTVLLSQLEQLLVLRLDLSSFVLVWLQFALIVAERKKDKPKEQLRRKSKQDNGVAGLGNGRVSLMLLSLFLVISFSVPFLSCKQTS